MSTAQRITVSEEKLNTALAEFELRIVREIQKSDDRSRDRHDAFRKELEGIPEMVRANKDDIEALKKRDWISGTLAAIAGIIGLSK